MKSVLAVIGRYTLTLCLVAVTSYMALKVWGQYEQKPWTRDGRVNANVVQVSPEVSGTISAVPVVDNQFVHQGDIIFVIDPERFKLAVASAQADVEAKYREKLVHEASARRRNKLKGVLSQENIQQTDGEAAVAAAAYHGAQVAFDLAKLNLARSVVRSPIDGYITNLGIRSGDYAVTGATKVAVLDANSFWVTGYFDETKLGKIRVGNAAQMTLMGSDKPLSGHVESIGRGINETNGAPGHSGLPSVDATFSWVRLAQRFPVRIHIDQVPSEVNLAAGMTASILINPRLQIATCDGSKSQNWGFISTSDCDGY
tara:strand:- start:12572 stop:13513 length:942 start_codon:yes stop_codon:yes gene_type:complete